MTTLSIDSFIEAFAARLAQKGRGVLTLSDPEFRRSLLRVFEFLSEITKARKAAFATPDMDMDRLIAITNIRNLFRPSPIGTFEEFEALLRAKQAYLTNHPNPYYEDMVIKLPAAVVDDIMESLDEQSRSLVNEAADAFLKVESAA